MGENGNEHAFPNGGGVAYGGLTKREYAAIMAMTAVTNPTHPDCDGYLELCAQTAVKMADALLLELEKPHNSPKQPTT